MKALAVWTAISLTAFSAAAGGYHTYLQQNPQLIALVVDSSYEMRQHVASAVRIANQMRAAERYAEFAVFTEKSSMHGFQSKPVMKNVKAYGPRDFTRLQDGALHDEITTADRVLVITNALEADTSSLPSNWEIVSPDK